MSFLMRNCRFLSLRSSQLMSPSSSILIRHCSVGEPSKSYNSQLFPGYKVIYSLEMIKSISRANRAKLFASALTGITVPIIYTLETMNVLPIDVASEWTLAAVTVAGFFHVIGYFCNNVVGLIYVNEKDPDDLKISYVNYWGRRADVECKFSEIDCYKSKGILGNEFYLMDVESLKKRLRLSTNGQVLDRNQYDKLFAYNE